MVINSEILVLDQKRLLGGMIDQANFFDLPLEITSNEHICFDCYHYTLTVEKSGKHHTVYQH